MQRIPPPPPFLLASPTGSGTIRPLRVAQRAVTGLRCSSSDRNPLSAGVILVARVSLTSQSLLDSLKGAKPNAAAWQRLQNVYVPLIRAWLSRDPGLRADVDDLVQEVLIVV